MKIVNPKTPFKYSDGKTPNSYRCGKCRVTGVKLWREYNQFLWSQQLYCYKCAGIIKKVKNVHQIDGEGKIPSSFGIGTTDQIASLIPAVPTEENDTFWGYTSVPYSGCVWWKRLPNDLIVTKKKGVRVRLSLTPKEAATLCTIGQHIGGDPNGTRGYMDSFMKKLRKQSKKFDHVTVCQNLRPGFGSIYFEP